MTNVRFKKDGTQLFKAGGDTSILQEVVPGGRSAAPAGGVAGVPAGAYPRQTFEHATSPWTPSNLERSRVS